MVKKIRINLIVFIISVALLSLVGIQIFQAVQLYNSKSKEFLERVATTLERITVRHEKSEDLQRYLAIVDRDFSGQYRDVLKQEFSTLLSSKESVSIRDTAILEDGVLNKYLVIRGKAFDSILGIRTNQEVMARDVRQVRELFNRDFPKKTIENPSDLSYQLDTRVTQQIFKKAKFINDMMKQAFRDNIYLPPAKRINLDMLDSIIRFEVAKAGLPHTYQFNITDDAGGFVPFENTNSHYQRLLKQKTVVASALFPGNTLQEPLMLNISFPKKVLTIFKDISGSILVSIGLIFFVIGAFWFMLKTILTQKKLSDMKNDFISNMTHEFRTPISTISLACEAMNDRDMMSVEVLSATGPFIGMIKSENSRLENLVERILQSAVIDRGALKLKKEKFTVQPILEAAVLNGRFRIQNKKGEITLELPKDEISIYADQVHFTNIVVNLIDNAIKYSKEVPKLHISFKKIGANYQLDVKDEGIGLKNEYLGKIFDKLYRVPTGNVHNVKGFGLGLSYVKSIVRLHNWDLKVKSTPNVGSTFTIIMH